MRDGGGHLSTRLAEEKGAGNDWDGLLCRELLCRRRQEESPSPPAVTSRVNKPAGDAHGNSQNEELSVEMKNDLSEVSLLLHDGNKVLPYLQESIWRNSASAAAQSGNVGLLFAPTGERFAGVSCGIGETQRRDWRGGGPRATDSHGGWSQRGEPWGSGLPCHQKWSEMGISEDEPPSALPEKLDSELDPSCLRSILSTLLHAHPQIFLNDETKCVLPGHSKPMFSEQRVEYKKMLSCVKSMSDDLQITLALLALHVSELADLLCHS
ncbi:protein FAM220A-like [Hippopotamus amphibius kiboko]|uniref:protein FAM220A-like n=1 Tax=Hippopotamus amphibius kiboko TaxID=575201 RepID=UPI0025960D39|nr:protein FAM220A-like [Hippopotamus amphibius kiboko]